MGQMDLASFFSLLGLKMGLDFEKRTFTVVVGPMSFENVPFSTLKSLRSDSRIIEPILSKQFIQRGVMWQDFRRERVDFCIKSLRELQTLCESSAEQFSESRFQKDHILRSVLHSWASECDAAAKHLQSALDDERDPINSGMDISARDSVPWALGEFRKATYPSVAMFIELLAVDNPVRTQAAKTFREGSDLLVKHFGISTSELVPPTIDFADI